MYAIIKTGGKQYKVKAGTTLRVEKIQVEAGSTIDFNDVLLVADGNTVKIGTPAVAESKVTATVQSHGRGEKIKIIKFRRRKHYRKQMGHRQAYTELKITDIILDIHTWVPKQEGIVEDTVLQSKEPVVEAINEADETANASVENITTETQLAKKDEENL
ncbi:MAG: 50S ribosomal protein L21 [Beggiatoa sp. IS2]|nr:MAG: 50S ribosomal protein L21 [Beggiatoa sp. IS2]